MSTRARGRRSASMPNFLCCRKALVENAPDVEKMRRGVWATLDHCSSTDERPNHVNCPEGPDSWCDWRLASAFGEKPPLHSSMSLKISEPVATLMRPLCERLTDKDLLARCARLQTQNANESLHSIVWNFCPKEVFSGRDRLTLGVWRAVSHFNMGELSSLKMRRNVPQDRKIPRVAVAIAEARA